MIGRAPPCITQCMCHDSCLVGGGRRDILRIGAHMKVPSPLTDLWLFAAYTAASVIGLLLLKHALPLVRADWQGGSFLTAPVLVLAVGACLYIASFAVWLIILARHELSAAYPTAIGLTLAFSTLAASVFLGEPLSFLRIGGIILIFIGIFFVTRF